MHVQKLKSGNPHSTQISIVLFVYGLKYALPEIVDGARKISQFGRWILVSARGRTRRFSLLPMLDTTLSRDQYMSALTYCITVVLGLLCKVLYTVMAHLFRLKN